MSAVAFTSGAIKICTAPQLQAIKRIAVKPAIELVDVHVGGFDLPEGYLTFRIDYPNRGIYSTIYGGISPEGDVST